MRSPDHRQLAQPRAGRHFEDELQLRYLAPGAFTVLPPTDRHPPDPPHAPEPYRLTPTQRRHKNQSFAILGEVDRDPNRPPSRSSSPSGRVSPFRGRGFNPSGSRHISPVPSPPPPDDARLTPTNLSPRHNSKIPQLKRRGSNNFGEKVYHYDASPTKRKISNKLSSSMTNLDGARTSNRPPPSPKRTAYSKAPAFQTLSPILGSSPEPSQSMSSPSRIPKSRSTPPSRKQSPSRTTSMSNKPPLSKPLSRNPSRSQSRNQSRTQSRNTSREPSPTKNPASPTRTSSQRYKNVQAKVNTFNKPKVLPKPQVLSEQSEDSDSVRNVNYKKPLNRKESVNRLRTTNSKSNLLSKNDNYNNNYSSTSDSNTSVVTKHFTKNIIENVGNNSNVTNNSKVNSNSISNNNNNTNNNNNNNNANFVQSNQSKDIANISKDKTKDQTDLITNSGTNKTTTSNNNLTNTTKPSNDNKIAGSTNLNASRPPEAIGKEDRKHDVDLTPSTTTVVSSTTTTATQPLKIETNLPPPSKQYEKPSVSPIVDGRVLSATSVSNAINKMNDTVLDTQTLMKDHGFSKLPSSTHATIPTANETLKTISNPALDTKNATTALPQVEPISRNTDNKITNNNHTNHVGHVMSSKALEMEVQKNLNKLIGPENTLINNQLPNDKIKEARTVIASDVQPIRINVREKPSEIEVQSGNIRLPSSVSNGLTERPGLPPAQQSPPSEPEKEQPPKNACSRFLVNCKRRMACDCCKKKPVPETEKIKKPTSCFSCLKKEKVEEIPSARLNVENESVKKPRLLDRLKCCGKQKVGDSSCFPLGKRKASLDARRGSIFSAVVPTTSSKCSKDCCKNILLALCCVNLCCKRKVVEEPVRKLSDNSKKKSLTPTTLPPPEDTTPKIDMSLVEHNSLMKGAIPILPVWLAWFCLVMNCILPGSGTILSGLFCLCIGIPRFSQKDGPKPRFGSFLINTIIGVGQCFTVLFCLVGWGWSIWWGVIMLKVARKHRKFKHLEKMEGTIFQPGNNARNRDPERHH